LTKRSTRTFFFSEVRKRSGSALSIVRMRVSKKRVLSRSGIFAYRPGCVMTRTTSPSLKTIAFCR
jgi:hypothetical protein